MEERFAVGLIVNNRFGVLDRIAGLYAKRCYNIDAISWTSCSPAAARSAPGLSCPGEISSALTA